MTDQSESSERGAMPVSDQPATGDFARLDENIYTFNAATTGIDDGRLLSVILKDAAGDIYAGLHGHTWGGCCEIKTIWIAEAHRRQGLGARLVRAAEREARGRGCKQILLTTHSFQAEGFYERLGFTRLATIENYPIGHAQILMTKTLTAA